jgi:hypothetical protein
MVGLIGLLQGGVVGREFVYFQQREALGELPHALVSIGYAITFTVVEHGAGKGRRILSSQRRGGVAAALPGCAVAGGAGGQQACAVAVARQLLGVGKVVAATVWRKTPPRRPFPGGSFT